MSMDVSPQNGTKPQPMPRWRLGLTVAAALLLLAVVALLRRFGMMIQILGLVLILGLAWGVVARFVAMARGRLNTALFTAPLDADNRPVLLCAMGRVVGWSGGGAGRGGGGGGGLAVPPTRGTVRAIPGSPQWPPCAASRQGQGPLCPPP